MNTTLLRSLLFALVATGSTAGQQPGQTEAESLYREAWWLETGEGALDRALQIYLRAARAEGPGDARAQALLRAATIQKRLSRTDEAIRTLEELTRLHADQAEVLAQARQRLTEWTATDLRKSFSSWYRRYLFSPEYQEKVVEMLHELGSLGIDKEARARRSEIEKRLLAIGDAAIPALREAAQSRNRTLAGRVTPLLLELGAMPPIETLLEQRGWVDDDDAWTAICALDPRQRQALERACSKRQDQVGLALAAAARGPQAMLELLASERGAELANDDDGDMLWAILTALHRMQDPAIHNELVALALRERAPLPVRRRVESVVAEQGWRGATAAEWFDWGNKAVTWEGRCAALRNAARLLRSEDGEILDGLRAFLGELRPELQERALEAIVYGMDRNGLPLQMPWTEDRIVDWLSFALGRESNMGAVFGNMRQDPTLIRTLADAILRHPAVLASAMAEHGVDIGGQIRGEEGSEENLMYLQSRWVRVVTDVVKQLWPGWSPADRTGLLDLYQNGLFNGDWPASDGDLQAFLVKQASDGDLDPATAARIKAMFEIQ